MQYTEEYKNYLSGQTFSNGAYIQLSDNSEDILYRDDYLIDLAKDKKVLHIGFVDHLPLIDEKIEKKSWLHKKLMDVSELCYGIDINKEGIEYIQNKYGYKNLYAVDIINDVIGQEIFDVDFDYIFIPDVIEHIGNPVEFLSIIKQKFQINVDKIVLTTPNALRLNNFVNIFKHVELVNTDHRFWFTPYTVSKIVTDAGFELNSLKLFEHSKLSRRQIVRKILLSKYNAFKDTLVLTASFK